MLDAIRGDDDEPVAQVVHIAHLAPTDGDAGDALEERLPAPPLLVRRDF